MCVCNECWFAINSILLFSGKTSVDDCLPCLAGSFCDTVGLAEPAGSCSEGWYCIRGAISSKPYDVGSVNYANLNISANCFCGMDETGGMCSPGEYCPVGSTRPQDCDPGKNLAKTTSTYTVC